MPRRWKADLKQTIERGYSGFCTSPSQGALMISFLMWKCSKDQRTTLKPGRAPGSVEGVGGPREGGGGRGLLPKQNQKPGHCGRVWERRPPPTAGKKRLPVGASIRLLVAVTRGPCSKPVSPVLQVVPGSGRRCRPAPRRSCSWPAPSETWRTGCRPSAGSSGPPVAEVLPVDRMLAL